MAAKTNKFKRAEVAKIINDDKMLIIVENRVYDVTQFLNDHPGGEEVLRDQGGKDATEDFQDVGHSEDALELMKKYLVGELVESERSNITPKPKIVPQKQQKKTETQAEPVFSLTFIAVAIFAVGIAALFYFNGL